MERKLVYLAHPLAGDWEANIASARRYAEAAARKGWAPLAPYLTLYGLLHEPADREIGIEIDFACIARCDEFWLCGDRVSPGMQAELDFAMTVPNRPILRTIPSPHDVPARFRPVLRRDRTRAVLTNAIAEGSGPAARGVTPRG